jgi:hypothetical protein
MRMSATTNATTATAIRITKGICIVVNGAWFLVLEPEGPTSGT